MKLVYKGREFEATLLRDRGYDGFYVFSGELPEWVDQDAVTVPTSEYAVHGNRAWPEDTICRETESHIFFYSLRGVFGGEFYLRCLGGVNKQAIAHMKFTP